MWKPRGKKGQFKYLPDSQASQATGDDSQQLPNDMLKENKALGCHIIGA